MTTEFEVIAGIGEKNLHVSDGSHIIVDKRTGKIVVTLTDKGRLDIVINKATYCIQDRNIGEGFAEVYLIGRNRKALFTVTKHTEDIKFNRYGRILHDECKRPLGRVIYRGKGR